MVALVNLLILFAVVVAPIAVFYFLWVALRFGFRFYPRITRGVVVGLILGVIAAALTFGRLFPGCYSTRLTHIPIGDCGPPRASAH